MLDFHGASVDFANSFRTQPTPPPHAIAAVATLAEPPAVPSDELSSLKARLADYEAYTRISAGLVLAQLPPPSAPTTPKSASQPSRPPPPLPASIGLHSQPATHAPYTDNLPPAPPALLTRTAAADPPRPSFVRPDAQSPRPKNRARVQTKHSYTLDTRHKHRARRSPIIE